MYVHHVDLVPQKRMSYPLELKLCMIMSHHGYWDACYLQEQQAVLMVEPQPGQAGAAAGLPSIPEFFHTVLLNTLLSSRGTIQALNGSHSPGFQQIWLLIGPIWRHLCRLDQLDLTIPFHSEGTGKSRYSLAGWLRSHCWKVAELGSSPSSIEKPTSQTAWMQ